MRFKVERRKNVNWMNVIMITFFGLLIIYIGGVILQEVFEVLLGTSSPLYGGLNILGISTSTCEQAAYMSWHVG